MSTVTKDYQNRKKVRDHYEGLGCQVELVQHRTKRGCRDLWGADLLVKGGPFKGFYFVQVKPGREAVGGRIVRDVAGPVKEFARHKPWPKSAHLVVALTLKGEKVPHVFDVTEEMKEA